jgi:hypothetical protein
MSARLQPCPDCTVHGHGGYRDTESAEECPTCAGDGLLCPHCGTAVCAKAEGPDFKMMCGFTGQPIPER